MLTFNRIYPRCLGGFAMPALGGLPLPLFTDALAGLSSWPSSPESSTISTSPSSSSRSSAGSSSIGESDKSTYTNLNTNFHSPKLRGANLPKAEIGIILVKKRNLCVEKRKIASKCKHSKHEAINLRGSPR